jgi:hypothetical protein
MGIDHLISRRPVLQVCARCRCYQLVGIDEGIPFRLDTVPLTVAGEIWAVMGNRRTYGLHVNGHATIRTAGRITLDAKYKRPVVLAAHRCHAVPDPALIDMPHVPVIAGLVDRAESVPADDSETAALFAVVETLGGRVVAELAADAPF